MLGAHVGGHVLCTIDGMTSILKAASLLATLTLVSAGCSAAPDDDVGASGAAASTANDDRSCFLVRGRLPTPDAVRVASAPPGAAAGQAFVGVTLTPRDRRGRVLEVGLTCATSPATCFGVFVTDDNGIGRRNPMTGEVGGNRRFVTVKGAVAAELDRAYPGLCAAGRCSVWMELEEEETDLLEVVGDRDAARQVRLELGI